jgi:hypothetical protein
MTDSKLTFPKKCERCGMSATTTKGVTSAGVAVNTEFLCLSKARPHYQFTESLEKK